MSAELESENLRVTTFSGPLVSLVTRRERKIFECSHVHLELSPNGFILPVGVTVAQDKTWDGGRFQRKVNNRNFLKGPISLIWEGSILTKLKRTV